MNTRISFCVVCMNRLHQLKMTLPVNIDANVEYDNLEFIILDYNSQDGLQEWIFENLADLIKKEKVVYYKTPDPLEFSHSHSKNMAFKLATGDILCNINADHYTGAGFATYVNELFHNNSRIVLTPIDYFKVKKNYFPPLDVMGKVCVKKDDFFSVTGFDENMSNYGFEDCDFINRLELNGLRRHFIEDKSYLNFISHTNEERYSTKKLTEKIHSFYVSYLTPSKSEILFLYKDNTFQLGTLINNSAYNSAGCIYPYLNPEGRYEFSLVDDKFESGIWTDNLNFITLSQDTFIKCMVDRREIIQNQITNEIFYLVTQSQSVEDLLVFAYQYASRSIMEKNLADKKIKTNVTYGKGTVYKNFDMINPIMI